MKHSVDLIPTEQERHILHLLRHREYQAITITRNGRSYHIKLKHEKRGDFTERQVIEAIQSKAYQTVTIHRVDGKQLVLKQEESVKI